MQIYTASIGDKGISSLSFSYPYYIKFDTRLYTRNDENKNGLRDCLASDLPRKDFGAGARFGRAGASVSDDAAEDFRAGAA